jgi:hypothetical protein
MADENNRDLRKARRKKPIRIIPRESMRQWTDQEALRFIDFFKLEAPIEYDEYVGQELKNEGIESVLWIGMRHIAARIFLGVDPRELDHLLFKAREYVRRTLGLRWE